jgi:hypothetical protein
VLEKIVSGGQSGVDRAALDAARAAGVRCGGWCPRDRWAEDGPIAACYPLTETPQRDPAQRTTWNVRDADATLVLTRGTPRGGTGFTVRCARAEGRPCLVVDLERGAEAAQIARWIERNGVRVLNVAGPRESQAPGIHADALALLTEVLAAALRIPRGERPGLSGTSR